jgi:hypothetical protein
MPDTEQRTWWQPSRPGVSFAPTQSERGAPMDVGSVYVVDDDDGYRELLAIVLETHCGVRAVRGFAR